MQKRGPDFGKGWFRVDFIGKGRFPCQLILERITIITELNLDGKEITEIEVYRLSSAANVSDASGGTKKAGDEMTVVLACLAPQSLVPSWRRGWP